jgi:SAM-dependent methyltransferase
VAAKVKTGVNAMRERIISFQDWLETPPGRYLLDWENAQFKGAVADIFGFHALQLGRPEVQALDANRMQHRWLASNQALPQITLNARPNDLVTEFSALPFPAASLDLVVLPHTLEIHTNPHAILREVARVLVPEGKVAISGLNPVSLWGLQRRREGLSRRLGWGKPSMPALEESIGYWRLRDWLHLLDFEIQVGHFGCYKPALGSDKWLQRMNWVDQIGSRWASIFGAAYFLVAVKRVHGVRLMGSPWRASVLPRAAPVPLAHRSREAGLMNFDQPDKNIEPH